jgi:pimeloyl-ACP methyl ester carboxylesterase
MVYASVDLPAGPLSYRETGPADGPVVVFVHGFLVDDTVWADVPERLAADGFRCLAPAWPLGSHRRAMRPGADLSPRGLARVVASFLEILDLQDVVLVGNDTGGAVCQLLLDEDSSRVGRLVLTNCDAFDTFPPFPFNVLFRLARSPAAARALLQLVRVGWVRNGRLGYGLLTHRRLSPEESLVWVAPARADSDVRRDVTTFARAWTGRELAGSAEWLRRYERPVLLVWGRRDRYFKLSLARRLLGTFPGARLVEVDDASTFVALDQPARLAEEIAAFASA